jgi:hypothetical protein
MLEIIIMVIKRAGIIITHEEDKGFTLESENDFRRKK